MGQINDPFPPITGNNHSPPMVDCYIIAYVCWLVLWSEVGPTTALKEGTGGGLLGLGGEGECGGWASLSSPNPRAAASPVLQGHTPAGCMRLLAVVAIKSTKKEEMVDNAPRRPSCRRTDRRRTSGFRPREAPTSHQGTLRYRGIGGGRRSGV